MGSFKKFLEERNATLHVKKGAFHAWLGKSPGEAITAADIAGLTKAEAAPIEAAPSMVSPPDAGDAGDAGETVSEACVLPAVSLCGGYSVHPPFTACTEKQGSQFISTVLPPCNTCETYNCACILTVIGCSRPTCAEKGGQVLVTCE